jgi:hypothetical protein
VPSLQAFRNPFRVSASTPSDSALHNQMKGRRTLDRLASRVEDEMTRSVSGRYFILKSKVEEIFSYSELMKAVEEINCEPYERVGLADSIYKNRVLIFAILIKMMRPDHIVQFRTNICIDHNLPLTEKEAVDIVPEFGKSFALEYQWQFLPYFFESDMSNSHQIIYHNDIILPIVGEEEVGEGGYGIVSRIDLSSMSQELVNSKVGDIRLMTLFCIR